MADKDERCWNVLSEIQDLKRYQDIRGQLNNMNIIDRISDNGNEQCGYVDRQEENCIQRVFHLWLLR